MIELSASHSGHFNPEKRAPNTQRIRTWVNRKSGGEKKWRGKREKHKQVGCTKSVTILAPDNGLQCRQIKAL
jgi:hypothetical protein